MNGLQKRAIELVRFHNGMKGKELSVILVAEFMLLEPSDILGQLFDLIFKGELVEIEYEAPGQGSCSYLLPKGTNVNVIAR